MNVGSEAYVAIDPNAIISISRVVFIGANNNSMEGGATVIIHKFDVAFAAHLSCRFSLHFRNLEEKRLIV